MNVSQTDAEGPMTVRLPEQGRPYVLVEALERADLLAGDTDAIIGLYKAHGALLFRGFDVDIAAFHAFTRLFCSTSVFNESPGRRTLDDQHNIQSVNLGTKAFPLHPELSREPWKPDVCFFACLTPPSNGGMTTICDGVAIVEALPSDIRAAFEGRRLMYIQVAAPEELDFWLGTPRPDASRLSNPPPGCPYRFARVHDKVLRIFTRPALHRPMFCDRPAFGNFLLFARYLNGRYNFPVLDDGQPVPEAWTDVVRDVGDELSVAIEWQAGDVLMLDNSRFMHGRTEIIDPEERMIASYFGYLSFAAADPEEPIDPIWRRTDFQPVANTVIAPRPRPVSA